MIIPLPPNARAALLTSVESFGVLPEEKAWALRVGATIFHGLSLLASLKAEELDVVVVGRAMSLQKGSAKLFSVVSRVLKPGGAVYITIIQSGRQKKPEELEGEAKTVLLLGGFIDDSVVDRQRDLIVARGVKPQWEVAAPLPLRKKAKEHEDAKTIWKAIAGNNDAELEDEDELLSENITFVGSKPAASTVKDCGTGAGGVRTACKNCSCGLKEELAQEAPKNENSSKSSGCGNCSKGDAFRCAACPYLGLPTFTPGIKPDIKVRSNGTKVLIDIGSSDFGDI